MLIKVDETARSFSFVSKADYADIRRYYVAQRSTGRRMIVVCRNGLDLQGLIGKTVDASLGWDPGTVGFVHDEQVGRKHSKLTLYRVARGRRRAHSLGRVLANAPTCQGSFLGKSFCGPKHNNE